MGVPYFQIKDIVKKEHIRIFSGHLALYRDVSRRVFEVLREEIDIVQQYSVDEAFFVMPDDTDPQELITHVKRVVEQQVGIPVSIGVGFSKTQAKCASEIAKKGTGTHVITSSAWDELITTLPIGSVWGVGRGLSARFSEHGIKTVADFVAVPAERIQVLFGVVGTRLQAELHGVICDPVGQQRELQKSLMSTRSFAATTTDINILADAVAYHTRHIAADLRAMQAGATTMRVSIRASRHGDFFLRGGSKEVVFTSATNDTMAMVRAAEEVLEQLYEADVPYQKVGVSVVGIEPIEGVPLTLFTKKTADNTSLLQAIDAINSAAGTEMITVGSRLQGKQWQAKALMRSPAYTTRWSDIAHASA
jgi:DNA polymerase V